LSTRGKRALLGAAVIAAALVVVFGLLHSAPPERMGEYASPDEQYLTAQIVASALSMVDMSHQYSTAHPLPGYPPGAGKNPGPAPYRRDVHSKTHGCLKATFTVLDGIDPRLRFGLFANPGQYESWIRFSSGKEYPQADSVPDARGMAIKVMGVPGRKLLEDDGLPPAGTQDFALMNSTRFFIRNINEYAEFTSSLGSGLGARAEYGYFFGGFTPDFTKWHLREMMLAKATLKPAPDSLLNTQFYSVSAYRLGPRENVKYNARPCSPAAAADVDRSDPNFLRQEMVKRLEKGSACFDFRVQPQVPGKFMPVEDTTVEWKEKDSPFLPVARLEIPAQNFEANNTVCEGLAFNPWHSLPDHRPIGVMNRIRKAVYLEVSRYRRQSNRVALCEPKDWNSADPGSCEKASPTPSPAAASATTAPQGEANRSAP
jgi:catalase